MTFPIKEIYMYLTLFANFGHQRMHIKVLQCTVNKCFQVLQINYLATLCPQFEYQIMSRAIMQCHCEETTDFLKTF